MSLGAKLRERRETLGLSLEAVGEAMGMHRSTVLRYETGNTQRVSAKTVEAFARVLHTTPSYLMGYEEAEETLDPEIRLIARDMQRLPPEKRKLLIRFIQTMSDIADEEMRDR